MIVTPGRVAKPFHTPDRCWQLAERNRISNQLLGLQCSSRDLREQLRVGGGTHAVAADQVELPGDDPADRHRWRRIVAEHQADLHMAAARCERHDGCNAGVGRAQSIHGDLDFQPVEQLRVDEVIGPSCPADSSARSRMSMAVTSAPSDLAIITAESPTPPQPKMATRSPACKLAWVRVGEGTVGGGEAATERCGGGKAHVIGQPDEIGLGEGEGDEFCECARAADARLVLVWADLRVAARALSAGTTSACEGRSHAVADVPRTHAAAERDNLAGKFVTEHVRQRLDVRIVALPGMPVAAAETGRGDPDHHASGRRIGAGEIDDF